MRSHAGEASRLLKALANQRRLLILCLLAEGERSVGELNELVDLSLLAEVRSRSRLPLAASRRGIFRTSQAENG